MSDGELGAMIRLAAPLAVQQAGFQLMGTVDALMLGHYSDAALAGAGVGNNVIFGISAIGMGVVMGMDTVVPQALGGGRTADARRAVGAGVRLAVLVGLLATLLVFASPLLLVAVRVAPDVVHEARPYIYLRAVGIVPFLITIALRSYLAAHGKTRPLIVAVIAGNIVNAGLDLVLIFPAGLGVIGAAAATTTVQLLTVAIYAAGMRAIDGRTPRPPSTADDIAAIARYGLPVGGQIFAEVGIFGIATVIAGKLGTEPAAAHSIALNISSFTFSCAVGIASATSVGVGRAVGAGDIPLARRRGLLGLRVGLATMACFAAAFLAAPAAIASAFTGQARTVAATVPLLQIAALFQLSDGSQTIGAGMLRGFGDTRATLWGNLLGHYVIGLPISLSLCFAAHRGAPGLWWGLSAGLTATAAYLIGRFLRNTRRSPRPGADAMPASPAR